MPHALQDTALLLRDVAAAQVEEHTITYVLIHIAIQVIHTPIQVQDTAMLPMVVVAISITST